MPVRVIMLCTPNQHGRSGFIDQPMYARPMSITLTHTINARDSASKKQVIMTV